MDGADQGKRRNNELKLASAVQSEPELLHHGEVRFATGLRAANQSIAWIGARIGAFAQYGLNATFPGLEVTGPQAVAGLLRGDWDFAQTGTVPVVEAVLKGEDAVILLRDSVVPDAVVIMAHPSITGLGQLGGKTVGILSDAYSGQTGVMARLALERAGADASYVGLGTYRDIFAALAVGHIDAGALPVDFRFLEGGSRWNCFEARSLNVPAVLATTRRTIAMNRERVLRVMRGFMMAMNDFRTRPDVVVPLLQEFLQISDRGAVERIHKHYSRLLPHTPCLDLEEGVQDLRNLFAGKYHGASDLSATDFSDPSLIHSLKRSDSIRVC